MAEFQPAETPTIVEPNSDSFVTQLITATSTSHQRLFKDALHMIYTYLNEVDWCAAIRVCQHWSSGAESSPSRHFSYPIAVDGSFRSPPPARLAHHFTKIHILEPPSHTWKSKRLQLSLFQFMTLGASIPALLRLTWQLKKPLTEEPVFSSPACLPTRIKVLTVDLDQLPAPDLIRAISTCCLSLIELQLTGISLKEDFSSFAQLDQHTNLTSLSLNVRSWRVQSFDLITAMQLTQLPPRLKYLAINLGRPQFFHLASLAKLPPSKTLESIATDELNAGALELLHQFAPNLLRFNLFQYHVPDLPLLARFTSLRYLTLWIISDADRANEPLLVSSICTCTSLTSLQFHHQTFHSTSSWSQLAGALHRLRQLEFIRIEPLPQLETIFQHTEAGGASSAFRQLERIKFDLCRLSTTCSGIMDCSEIKEFFRSPTILPTLIQIDISTFFENFLWHTGMKNHADENYRRTPPSLSPPVVIDCDMMPSAAAATLSSPTPLDSVAQAAMKEDETNQETIPSPRLVGVEVNPGPPIHPSSHKRTPNLADLVDQPHSTKKPRGTPTQPTLMLADTDEVPPDEFHPGSMSESEINDAAAAADHTSTACVDEFLPYQVQLSHAPFTTTMDLTSYSNLNDGSSYSTTTLVTKVVPGRLLKEMIHLINSYLNDTDWISSMLVNHHWLACGASSSSRHLSYPINENGVVRSHPPPRLLHHFTSIKHVHHFSSRATGLTPTLLITLFQQLPYLTDVTCEFEQWEVMEDQEVNWPHQLNCLDIDLSQVNTKCISSVFNCHTITTLKLIGIRREVDPIIFHSLNQLIHLRILVLYFLSRSKDNKPIDLLSMMNLTRLPPHLNHFDLNGGNEGFLDTSTLATMVPAVELDDIDLSDRIQFGPNDLERIHQFAPNIKQFHPPGCHPSHLSLLSQFHRLQHIHLQPLSESEPLNYEALLTDVLASTTQLTSIHFDRDWLPTSLSSWQQLSRSLIHLTSLKCTTNRLPDLNLFTSLLTLTSLILRVFSNDHDHDDQAIMRHYVHQFFQSHEVMPNLQRISLYFSYGDPAFEWRSGQARNDHYRCSQPSADSSNCTDVPSVHPPPPPLVGVESNPGPISDLPSNTSTNIRPMDDSSLHVQGGARAKMLSDTKASSATSSSIDLSAVPSSSSYDVRSNWHLLTRDYMESITTFLTLIEIALTMMRTSKQWYAVVMTMRNRKDDTTLSKCQLFAFIKSKSPIHRLFHGLRSTFGVELSCTKVNEITAAFPHLRMLSVYLYGSYRDIARSTTPLQLPPRLESLDFGHHTRLNPSDPLSVYVSAMRTVVLAVSQLTHLRSLQLCITPLLYANDPTPAPVLPVSVMEPLLNLKALELLHLAPVPPLTPEIAQLLCCFSSLTEHRSRIKWTPQDLDALTSDRPERFQIINLAEVRLTDAYVPFISRCVNLRELDSTFEMVSVNFLLSFVNLKSSGFILPMLSIFLSLSPPSDHVSNLHRSILISHGSSPLISNRCFQI